MSFRKSYPKSNLERDQMCKCGHIAYEHEIEYAPRFSIRYLVNVFRGKLYTGKCDSCNCILFNGPENITDKKIKTWLIILIRMKTLEIN